MTLVKNQSLSKFGSSALPTDPRFNTVGVDDGYYIKNQSGVYAKFLDNNNNDTRVICGFTAAHNINTNGGGIAVYGSNCLENYVPSYGDAYGIFSAGYNNSNKITSGYGHIHLGANIDMSGSPGNYNHTFGVGYGVVLNGSNKIVFGAAFAGFDNMYVGEGVSNPNCQLHFASFAFKNKASDPTTSDIGAGFAMCYKNTTSGVLSLWANDAGTMKSITLL